VAGIYKCFSDYLPRIVRFHKFRAKIDLVFHIAVLRRFTRLTYMENSVISSSAAAAILPKEVELLV
jgi:hypothetical protein